jgi:hypothetical protein
MPVWVGRLAWRFWTEDWADDLVQVAIKGGADSDAALRVLSRVPRLRLEPGPRQRFAARVLHIVHEGGDESWFESMAPRFDSPELRDALDEAAQHADRDVRRRASWARNALRRAEERDRRPAGP